MSEELCPEDLFDNEWHIVRYSGETPEIAFHSALYFLTRHPEGPLMELSEEQQSQLKDAALVRYREIVLRDLCHENAGASIYRGIERSMVNYRRCLAYCRRNDLECEQIRAVAAEALVAFLQRELLELSDTGRESLINCDLSAVIEYAEELGCFAEVDATLEGLARYCRISE